MPDQFERNYDLWKTTDPYDYWDDYWEGKREEWTQGGLYTPPSARPAVTLPDRIHPDELVNYDHDNVPF